MDDVTVFVLAGGQSTRMGRDKALLRLGGQTLLERALALAHRIAPRVAVLGPREKYAAAGERIIEDEFPGCGPLAGIHAALGTSETDLNLILSVDMPFVPLEFFTYLLERARSRLSAQVTVPRVGGIVQGTCVACRRSFRSVCESRLKLGLCKVEDAIRLASPEYVEEEEIRARGIGPDVFRNLNTPEDLTEPQKLEG
jgi:molybdopterin-guanine dinucleotide biosynthesis protein A